MDNTISFEGIGTHWEIEIYTPITPSQLGFLQLVIKQRVEKYDRLYSRFRPDSFVNNALLQKGIVKLPDDFEKLLTIYNELYKLTDGLFTPLIGQVLIDAGYDAHYSLKSKKLHSPPPWEEVADFSFPTANIKKSVAYDFGAAGKGHLIDIVSDLLIENNVPEFCVNAGNDIRLFSEKPIRIGLENPLNTKEAIGVATISSGSICGSAGNRRTWGKYHHIINPTTLQSPDTIIATWTLAREALVADALSTSLFLVSAKKLIPHFSFEYLILFADNTFEKSPLFPAEIFVK